MKEIIKLTNQENQIVFIGTKHIVQVKDLRNNANVKDYQSEVNSLGAMMTTNHVKESIEEIYALIYPSEFIKELT